MQPYHSVGSGYEQLALLFNLVQVGATGMALARPAAVGLYGPLICVSKTMYDQVGGYASVHGSIVEDMALGVRFHQAGYAIRLYMGGDRIRFRMYRDGLASLVRGWTKNFASGASKSPVRLTLLVFCWVAGCAAVPVGLCVTVFAAQWVEAALFALLYIGWVWEIGRIGRKTGSFHAGTYLLYPLSLALFIWVFVRSAVKKLFKRPVQWKGRKIPWR